MERRREARDTIERCASYRLGSTAEWQACRVVDMGSMGIAIEPFDLLDDHAFAGPISIKTPEPPEWVAEELEILGKVRHRTRTADGRVRLGIEFRGFRFSKRLPSMSFAGVETLVA